jgi:hypothetical protein
VGASFTGNVGIGTANPTLANLQVQGNVSASSFTGSFSGSVSAPGSTTQVVYNSGGSLAADSGFVYSGSRVGIGITSPTAKLHVQGTSYFFDQSIFSDKVGIGTTSPSVPLHIYNSSSALALLESTNASGSYATWRNSGTSIGDVGAALAVSGVGLASDFMITSRSGNMVFGSAFTERMRITSAGNVGIGTTSPDSILHVNGYRLRLGDGASDSKLWGTPATGGNFLIGQSSSTGKIKFVSSTDADLVTILNSGNVGIGTTSPGYKLDVRSSLATIAMFGGTYAGIQGIQVQRNGGDNVRLTANYSGYGGGLESSDALRFSVNGADISNPSMYIETTGNVGIGTANPAQKLDVVGKMKISDDIILAQTNGRIDYDNGVSTGALRFFSTSGNTERMRITSAGNVGIGTTNPLSKLHVSDSGSATAVYIGNTGSGVSRTYFDASNGDFSGSDYMWIGQNNDLSGELVMLQSAGAFHIKTQPGGTVTSRLTVLQNGNVGIGTTSPLSVLNINAEDAESVVTISRGGTTPTTNTAVGRITFKADYSGIPTEFGYIYTHTNDIGSARGSMDFGLKSTSGTVLNGMTLYGTNADINVGIGIANPGDKLVVDGTNVFTRVSNTSTGDGGIKISYGNSNTHGLHLLYNPGSAIAYIDNTYPTSSGQVYGDIQFRQNISGSMTPRMVIKAENGNVGINTTSPTNKLQVVGGITATSFTGSFSGSVAAPGSTTQVVYNSGGSLAADSGFVYSGSRVGIGINPDATLDVNGNVYIRPAGTLFTNTIAGYSTNLVAMAASTNFVVPTGNVGIGTTNVSTRLRVDNSSTQYLVYQADGNLELYTPESQTGYVRLGAAYNLNGVYGSNGFNYIVEPAFNHTFRAQGTALMTITGGGNVGIGTTSPDVYSFGGGRLLAVSDTSTYSVLVLASGNANSGGISMGNQTIRRAAIDHLDGSHLAFYTNGTNSGTTVSERMRITSGGNVGIGTTSPSSKLEVYTATGDTKLTIATTGGNSYVPRLSLDKRGDSAWNITSPAGGFNFAIDQDGTTRLWIASSTGNVGIGTSSPSYKLDVNGTGRFVGNSGAPALQITDGGSTFSVLGISGSQAGDVNWLLMSGYPSAGNFTIRQSDTVNALVIQKTTGAATFSAGVTATSFTGSFSGSVSAPGSTTQVVYNSGGSLAADSGFVYSGSFVGIGITNPSYPLTIYGDSFAASVYQTSATGAGNNNGFYVGHSLSISYVWNYNNFPLVLATNNTERVRITGGGNVGIGTTSPLAILDVYQAGQPQLRVRGTTGANHLYQDSTTGTTINDGLFVGIGGNQTGYIYHYEANPLVFATSNAERMRILAGGNVGIGVTNPEYLLDLGTAGSGNQLRARRIFANGNWNH